MSSFSVISRPPQTARAPHLAPAATSAPPPPAPHRNRPSPPPALAPSGPCRPPGRAAPRAVPRAAPRARSRPTPKRIFPSNRRPQRPATQGARTAGALYVGKNDSKVPPHSLAPDPETDNRRTTSRPTGSLVNPRPDASARIGQSEHLPWPNRIAGPPLSLPHLVQRHRWDSDAVPPASMSHGCGSS